MEENTSVPSPDYNHTSPHLTSGKPIESAKLEFIDFGVNASEREFDHEKARDQAREQAISEFAGNFKDVLTYFKGMLQDSLNRFIADPNYHTYRMHDSVMMALRNIWEAHVDTRSDEIFQQLRNDWK